MLSLLQRLLAAPDTADPDDARVALAALMVEAARSDGDYAEVERARIAEVLAVRFGLAPAEAARLRAEGEAAQAEAVDLVRFTRAVKQAVAYEDRIGVLEALWEVVYADGEREMHESALMRKLCGLLQLEDRDVGVARLRVAQRLGIG